MAEFVFAVSQLCFLQIPAANMIIRNKLELVCYQTKDC